MKRPNGSGTVFKRGNTWTAQVTLYTTVTEDGKVKRKYKTKGGFRTKKDALSYLSALKDSETRKVPTLLELYTVYENNDIPKLSKGRGLAMKKARERIEPIIGRKVDSLTTSDLQTIVNETATTYFTAADVKTLLHQLYKKACADQFVPSNLASYIVCPPKQQEEPQPFTADEVDKIWKAYGDGDEFAGYLLIMIYSGMMPGELLDCKSEMKEVQVSILGAPAPKVRDTVYCLNDVPVALDKLGTINQADASKSYELLWTTTKGAAGPTTVPDVSAITAAAGQTKFYVSQREVGTNNESSQMEIIIDVYEVLMPTAQDIETCKDAPVSLSATAVNTFRSTIPGSLSLVEVGSQRSEILPAVSKSSFQI